MCRYLKDDAPLYKAYCQCSTCALCGTEPLCLWLGVIRNYSLSLHCKSWCGFSKSAGLLSGDTTECITIQHEGSSGGLDWPFVLTTNWAVCSGIRKRGEQWLTARNPVMKLTRLAWREISCVPEIWWGCRWTTGTSAGVHRRGEEPLVNNWSCISLLPRPGYGSNVCCIRLPLCVCICAGHRQIVDSGQWDVLLLALVRVTPLRPVDRETYYHSSHGESVAVFPVYNKNYTLPYVP